MTLCTRGGNWRMSSNLLPVPLFVILFRKIINCFIFCFPINGSDWSYAHLFSQVFEHFYSTRLIVSKSWRPWRKNIRINFATAKKIRIHLNLHVLQNGTGKVVCTFSSQLDVRLIDLPWWCRIECVTLWTDSKIKFLIRISEETCFGCLSKICCENYRLFETCCW